MSIKNALTKTFGRNYNNFKGEVGLEIETESREDYRVPAFSFWVLHNDGSLRDIGREYVLRQPLMVEKELPEALKEFADKTKDIKFIKDSITTSTHVHLNMLNENFVTLGNFLTLYTLVENLLIRFSGEDRKSNLFCLPICDAEEIFYSIVKMMQGIGAKKYNSMNFPEDNVKYGALNLSSLVAYGSLEVRSFRGTTDIALIEKWVRILYCILVFARQTGLVPPQIILQFKEKGPKFLSDVFGQYREDLRHPEEEKLLEKNFWYSASIAYSIKNWEKLEVVEKPKKAKPKDLEKIAQQLYGLTFESLSFEQQQLVINRSVPQEEVREERNPFRPLDRDFVVTAPRGGGLRATAGTIARWADEPAWVTDARHRIENDMPMNTDTVDEYWRYVEDREDREARELRRIADEMMVNVANQAEAPRR